MNELQVVVEQEPGVIRWNFEQLKAALADKLQTYEGLVYTDDTVALAREDVAGLRKLKKAISDKRIEIKNKCLEPYETIEKQAKELTELIDRPITKIDEQVKDYDQKCRDEKKAIIMKYMDDVFSDLPENIRKKAQFKTYDPKWENKTCKTRDWQNSIQAVHGQTVSELDVIRQMDPDFVDTCMAVYEQNLSLTEAVSKEKELTRQREQIKEAERRRLEEKEQREREEAARRQEAEKPQPAEEVPEDTKVAGSASENETEEKDVIRIQKFLIQAPEIEKEKIAERKILFYGSDEQYKKVTSYIRYIGARYEEC